MLLHRPVVEPLELHTLGLLSLCIGGMRAYCARAWVRTPPRVRWSRRSPRGMMRARSALPRLQARYGDRTQTDSAIMTRRNHVNRQRKWLFRIRLLSLTLETQEMIMFLSRLLVLLALCSLCTGFLIHHRPQSARSVSRVCTRPLRQMRFDFDREPEDFAKLLGLDTQGFTDINVVTAVQVRGWSVAVASSQL